MFRLLLRSMASKITNCLKVLGKTRQVTTCQTFPKFFIISAFYAYSADLGKLEKKKEKFEPSVEQQEAHRLECLEHETMLARVMFTLSVSIAVTSEKYRQILLKQIDATRKCMEEGEYEKYVEELQEYRAETKYLKEELVNFEGIVDKVGHIALELAVKSNIAGNQNAKLLFVKDYCRLEKLTADQLAVNYTFEVELLVITRDYLIHAIQESVANSG